MVAIDKYATTESKGSVRCDRKAFGIRPDSELGCWCVPEYEGTDHNILLLYYSHNSPIHKIIQKVRTLDHFQKGIVYQTFPRKYCLSNVSRKVLFIKRQ